MLGCDPSSGCSPARPLWPLVSVAAPAPPPPRQGWCQDDGPKLLRLLQVHMCLWVLGDPASRSLKPSFALKGETCDSLSFSAVQTEICLWPWLHPPRGCSCLISGLCSQPVFLITLTSFAVNLAPCLSLTPSRGEKDRTRGMLKGTRFLLAA